MKKLKKNIVLIFKMLILALLQLDKEMLAFIQQDKAI